MAILTFDVALFRAQFPVFSNVTTFPDALLQMYWDMAICYIDDEGAYGYLQGACRQLALNYMTAHIAALNVLINGGEIPGFTTSATVDKVSVTVEAPDNKNQWQWWLNQTPYGAALIALLEANAVGGFSIGGLPERSAFRKVGGTF